VTIRIGLMAHPCGYLFQQVSFAIGGLTDITAFSALVLSGGLVKRIFYFGLRMQPD
jgi:hypothetical protein